jgi:hypothetical protein
LGVDKYFGFTAHTGDVADNHDIYSMQVRDLSAGTVDLAAAREKYHDRIRQEQNQPLHQQDVSASEFQVNVMTILNQVCVLPLVNLNFI